MSHDMRITNRNTGKSYKVLYMCDYNLVDVTWQELNQYEYRKLIMSHVCLTTFWWMSYDKNLTNKTPEFLSGIVCFLLHSPVAALSPCGPSSSSLPSSSSSSYSQLLVILCWSKIKLLIVSIDLEQYFAIFSSFFCYLPFQYNSIFSHLKRIRAFDFFIANLKVVSLDQNSFSCRPKMV